MADQRIAIFRNELKSSRRDPQRTDRAHDFELGFAAVEGGRYEFVDRLLIGVPNLPHDHDSVRRTSQRGAPPLRPVVCCTRTKPCASNSPIVPTYPLV